MSSTADLDKQYSPSLWVKRFPPGDEVLEHHVKVATEETQKNLEKYKCNRNVPYGTGEMERMDIYFAGEETGSPIVVYIHGGYWQELSKESSAYCASPLIERGYRVIILDYDLCPQVTLEEIVKETKRAVEAIFEYADQTNAKGVTIVGHSAGAHLIASVLQNEDIMHITNLDRLVAVFFISGVFDLTDLRKTCINRDNILSLDEINERNCSPIFQSFTHLKLLKTAFYVYVAQYDSPVFNKQSRDFQEHLKNVGLSSDLIIVKNCDHFDVVENLSYTNFEITQKIIKHFNN